ncbi:MAG: dTMP kinase [Gemmatales bacterium]
MSETRLPSLPYTVPMPTHHVPSGLFLSLDGVDGAGKSTQMKLLADWLRTEGYTVTTCRDPGGTHAGDKIRHLLLDRQTGAISPLTETFLYMASRCQLMDEVIRPALDRGEIVLCDRFILSTVVYQGYAGNLRPELCWKLGRTATDSTLPEVTFVFDMPVAEAQARKQGPDDRMEDKGSVFLESVRAGFIAEAKRNPEHLRLIAANRSIEEVQTELQEEVRRALARHLRT